MMQEPYIITIGRQYGSGGREIGKALANNLGIHYYDKELVTKAAKLSVYDINSLVRADETAVNTFLHSLTTSVQTYSSYTPVSENIFVNNYLFNVQSAIIKKLAKTHSCVIIGRCADYVLNNHPNRLSLFIYGDLEARIDRVVKKYDVTPAIAKSTISKIDKRRSNYYNYYTGQHWDDLNNYDLTLDSSTLGVENCLKIIEDYVRYNLNNI